MCPIHVNRKYSYYYYKEDYVVTLRTPVIKKTKTFYCC